MSDPTYKNIPVLSAYIDRIGAEELNWRKFMVKEHRGEYYTERSLITIKADGSISCTNKEYAPTEEEAEEIQDALKKAKFPKSIGATASKVKDLRMVLNSNSILYEFLNHKDEVIMVQERTTIKGKKAHIPWTFWSDGEWRKMEPEGALPFWKPTARARKPRIMIHEGAKAAKFVDHLVNGHQIQEDAKGHPWLDELSAYEHWGLIGGALAPHRADYSELIREKPVEVVYVCDNDFPGKSALQAVSRCYGGAMKGIMFDGRWAHAWDMADPMPKNLYTGKGRYVGPALKEMMQLATAATEIVPNPSGKGRGLTVIRSAFVEEWFHSVTPEVFVHKDWSNRIYTLPEFNSVVRPFSEVDDTARLLKGDAASKSAVLKYSPAHASGIYGSGEAGRFINTHCPTDIKPEKGDPQPFLDYMEHLVPDEGDRIELLRWCATLIARPEVKILYGVLMISETQGIGKGTLGEKILAPLVGMPNVSFPNEKEIVDSNFNYWLAHKRLAVVHEIYAGHNSKAYNNCKSLITDRYITVSKKYQANYEIENWIHIFACSNSMRALRLPMDDRRWFVPKVTESKKPPKYWGDLNVWLNEGGLQIISWWANEWLKTNHPVLRGDPAPWSEIKKEIVEEGYSPGQALVARVLERLKEAVEGRDEELKESLTKKGQMREGELFVVDRDLVELIKNNIYEGRHSDRLEKPLTVRKVAKAYGWFVSEHKVHSRSVLGNSATHTRLLCSSKHLAGVPTAKLFGNSVPEGERLMPVAVQSLIEI